ncbi:protein sidekick-2-like [Hydractinia symbiolongicarpus]|uniref:protein sidekick-2-like n=1 Tax=Hydractinia symbiolongicarpus TaxID=13093 RepID=UPI00254C0AC4|nr:protein sidekick-2-like [Hydractinia symbiolongicarpus]
MNWILFFMLAYRVQGAIPKPTVEILKGSTTLDTGSVLQLNCSIDTDVRNVTFEWLRDGRIILGSFQSLNITNITKDHAGIYFCTAEDSTGFKQRSSNQYNIIVNYLENATLVITPSNNVNEGDSVTFHCSVNSNLNSLVYTMKRNKSIFIKSALPVHNITHILKIYSGLWICNVLSRTTSLPPVTSESILMTVTELFQIPIFHVSSNSLNSGESLVLTCNVTTSLSPGIIKYRFRSLLFSSPFQSSDTYNKTVRTTDKSLYWCEAKHNFVKWSQGMFIEVKWKVNIVITPTIEGNNMSITCNVEGEEIAGHFSWKRNGFLINGQTSSTIIVANVNRTMVGTSYSCIAGSDPTRSNEAAAIVSFRDFYYKPDPPSLQIFSTSQTSIKVVIIPPTDTGNKPIIHYTMHLQAGNESYTYTNMTSLIYNIWNLEPVMTYQLRVKAVNVIGEGEFSEFVSVVTGESPPSAPLQFSHTILHPQKIRLSWLKPDPSNGVITNYRICYVQDTNDGVKVKNSVKNCTEIGNVTAFTLTGLGFYNGYNVSVSARNSAGYGSIATQNQLVTREGAPTAPLKFSHDTIFHPQEIRLSWLKPDPSNGVITNYRLCYVQDTSDGVKVKNSVTNCTEIGNGNAFTLTGLGFYNGYNVSVSARNSAGYGSVAILNQLVTQEGAPTPVQDISLISGETLIKVLWKKPKHIYGKLQGYTVRYHLSSGNASGGLVKCSNVTELTCLIDNLLPNKEYVVIVTAMNSLFSTNSIRSTRTRSAAPTAPLKFGLDTIFHPQEIELSWLKPDPSNGVITNYRICYVQDTNDGVKVKNSVTNCTEIGNVTAFTLTGLGFYNGYNVSVSARNSAGYGSVAILNQLVTQEGAPTPVQDISLISGETLIKVLWKKPKHIYGKLQGYTVTFRLSSGNASSGLMKCIKVTELTCLIDNLLPNKEYVVIVTAMNSLFSTNSTRRTRTRSAVQTNYKNIFVIPGNSVTLKWSIASDYSIEILSCTKGVRKIADGKKGLIAVHNNLNDNRYTASADGKTYQVSIQDLTASDSGVYKCRFILKKSNVVREVMDKIQVTVDDFVDGYQVLGSQTLLIGMTIYELTANISGVMIKIEDINKSLLLHTFIIEFKNYLEVIFLSVFYANVSVKIIQPLKTTKVNFTLSYQRSLLISGDEIKAAFRTSVGKYNNEISFPQNIFYAKIQADSATFKETNICSQRELKKCSENADCKNIPKWYSHACKCKEGFKGNGSTCSKKTPAQGLSKGVIIGSTAGGLAFMILIVAICYVVCKRSKKIKEKRQEKETVENEPYYSDINDTPVIADQEYVEMKSNYTEVKPTLESCYTTLSRT